LVVLRIQAADDATMNELPHTNRSKPISRGIVVYVIIHFHFSISQEESYRVAAAEAVDRRL
jgi:hypothetical protein